MNCGLSISFLKNAMENHLAQHSNETSEGKSVQLDSGSVRTTSHKLYFKEGFTINAFHFNITLRN